MERETEIELGSSFQYLGEKSFKVGRKRKILSFLSFLHSLLTQLEFGRNVFLPVLH